MTSRHATGADLSLTFRAVAEPTPGPHLRGVFEAHWPAYARWMLKNEAEAPPVAECERQLRAHMPELAPIYDAILDLVGRDDNRDRFLTQYAPTPIIRGCSQAVVPGDSGPIMIRNYDHAPHLCDGVVLASRWGGVGVHALTDCLWGALDGVNEAGLVVALAFGGRKALGPGFSASLVVRYLLQTCATVHDAAAALRRLPVYMPYNFALLDRSGAYVTVYTGPDRPAILEPIPVSTNHQRAVDWPEYARFTESLERHAQLAHVVTAGSSLTHAVGAFLRPPLFRDQYRRGSGTLYTAAYDPRSMDVSLFWRDGSVVIAPTDRPPARITVHYRDN